MSLSFYSQRCFERAVAWACFLSLKESLWLLYLVLHEIVFCHADVSREPRCSCDSRFVDDVICETYIIRRAKVLVSAIALSLSRGHVSLIAFIQDLLVVVFH